MREILFRGKRVDNGEWIHGAYGSHFNGIYDLTQKRVFRIIPNTVGQYTGLTDKNGNKIFEGDIIEIKTVDKGARRFGIIKFGSFIDSNSDEKHIGFYIEYECHFVSLCQIEVNINWIEIIGNIHDNPELLEVETK